MGGFVDTCDWKSDTLISSTKDTIYSAPAKVILLARAAPGNVKANVYARGDRNAIICATTHSCTSVSELWQ